MPRKLGESPLYKRIARSTIQIIGGLGVGLLVAVLLVAWRLAAGPVSIGFLSPYIHEALAEAHQGAFDISFDDTILTWAGWERTLDIRVTNLTATLPSGDEVASIPEVSISLSANALMRGTIAPRSVEFFGPSLMVVRQPDGRFELGLSDAGDGSQDFVSALVLIMLQDPDPGRAMTYLKRISFVAGQVMFVDHALGTTWFAPEADASVVRDEGGLKAELDMSLKAGDKLAAVSVLGNYSPEGERMDLGVSFEDVTPAAFAQLSDETALLSALDLPLAGTITLSIEQDGRIEGFGFDVTGADGDVAFPVSVAADMGALPWAQRIGVKDLAMSGRFDGARGLLDITNLTLTPKTGETVFLPAPFNDDMPVSALEATLQFSADKGRLEVPRLSVDMDGARVDMNATLSNLGKGDSGGEALGLFADLNATAVNVPFDRLAELWPQDVGVQARKWVLAGLSRGTADRATLSLALRPAPGGETRLASLAGQIHAKGVEVDYLPPMTRVTNASATANFNENRFDISLEGGDAAGGLKVVGGDIALFDLQADVPRADITLDVDGPIAAALKLIDAEPLGFAADLGIDPQSATGRATARVNLQMPLLEDMHADDVQAHARATLTEAGLRGVVFDKDLSDGELVLEATNTELSVEGAANLGGVPVQMVWKHDFRDGALFLDRYELSGYIENVLNLRTLGIQVPEVLSRYMSGGAEANVSYTVFSDGRQALSAGVDLANIQLSAPELGWEKAVGVPGNGTMELRLNRDIPREIPKFVLSAPNMDVSGAVSFTSQGKLERVDIDTMRTGLTDVVGSLTPRGDNLWELVLRGESLDARNLWEEFVGIRETAPSDEPEPDQGDDLGEDFLAINAAVDVHTVVMHQNRVIEDLIGTLYRRDGLWTKMDVVGIVKDGAPVQVLLDRDSQGLRYLSITSTNAGSALKRLDLYDNMLGGTLDLKAAYTSSAKDAPLEGVVKISNFAMIDAPAFTKLIGVMSLTGVLDALQGEGLNFDIAEAPFTLKDGVLTLTQARASGPSIGVTTNGKVDMDNRVLDLQGTVVPAYAINALLGKIPLIGELFVGSEKGGGLFAATYTMKGKGENVDITVNPLSALAPGALRNIFTGSGKEKDIPVEATPQPEGN